MYIITTFAIMFMLTMNYGDCSLTKESSSVNVSNVLNTSQVSGERQIFEYTHRIKWLCFNSSDSEFDCCKIRGINCLESGPALPFGYCATYRENDTTMSLSTSKCPYLQWNDYNVTTPWFISLPVSLTELNDYMCGPQNRKGLVCSECADGFGPSVTSYGYKCANCTNAWYHIPLFLLAQFLPSTVLYVIVLASRISVVSPPMPSLIICIQLFALGFDMTLYTHSLGSNYYQELTFTDNGPIRLDMKIIHIIYSFFNQLDVLHYVLPATCLNSNLKQVHVYFFRYVSVFFPILLIILTWVCITIHDNNVRPFVWLWRPFHKHFVRLRRKWDIKSNLIDTFITFFLLSYIKSAYQAIILLTNVSIITTDRYGSAHSRYQLLVDPTIDYFGYTHLPFALTAVFLLTVFNILPALLLILYPFGAFRSCLSRCRLDFIAVNIFTDKVHGCYRNGLDGGKDMRYFSGLYLCLWMGMSPIASVFLKEVLNCSSIWFSIAVSFQIMAIILAIAKPYRKMFMNYMDALLHICLSLQLFSMISGHFRITRVLISIPIVALFLMIVIKLLIKCLISFKASLKKCCSFCPLRIPQLDCNVESTYSDNSEAQLLIQPTQHI